MYLPAELTPEQRESVSRQAIIGWLQTILLAVVIVQIAFAGVLRALPPDIRVSLSFLHRIEWGAYAGIVLVAVQVAAGWSSQTVLTNRFYALGWRFSTLRVVTGSRARHVQMAYLILVVAMIGAVVWVRLHGFIVQPVSRG